MGALSSKPQTRFRVLIIDDDFSVIKMARAHFQNRPYDVFVAGDARTGLDVAAKEKPDIIICDLMLPDYSGYKVFMALQKLKDMRDVPFIMISGAAEQQKVRRGMDMGIDDYLVKPFSMADLESAIQSRLNRRNAIVEKYDTRLRNLRHNITHALPHEMRTPLFGILGYSELLTQDPELTLDEAREFGKRIHNSSKRLQRVIENYLVYAQLELLAGDPQQLQDLRNAIIHSLPVIQENAFNLSQMHERPSDLHLDLQQVAIPMRKENLSKIVFELVDNAFKFSKAGTPVRVISRLSQGRYVLQVADSGRGIAPDMLESIGAYMQFDRKLYEQQGLGLGLGISKRLVELHKGTFQLKSVLGKGTTVSMMLPMQ